MMKFKIIIFSLILIMSLSLVCAFESQVYHIGVNVPSDDSENDTIEVIVPDDPGTSGGSPSGGTPSSDTSPPEQNITDESQTTNQEGEPIDVISGEPEPKTPLGNFYDTVGLGGVVGTIGTAGTTGVLVFILGTIGAFVFVRFKRRKK